MPSHPLSRALRVVLRTLAVLRQESEATLIVTRAGSYMGQIPRYLRLGHEA